MLIFRPDGNAYYIQHHPVNFILICFLSHPGSYRCASNSWESILICKMVVLGGSFKHPVFIMEQCECKKIMYKITNVFLTE